MSDKPMIVVRKTDSCIELRGFPIKAWSPLGWQEVDYSDYGFVVYYEHGKVIKCILHMYDRNTYIEYKKVNDSTIVRTDKSNNIIKKTSCEQNEGIAGTNNLFSKKELEELIIILSKMSYMFGDSKLLRGGRNKKMKSRLQSYAGIMGYYYEVEYGYGKMSDITDREISDHYVLVKLALSDSAHKARTICDLADNWSDILQVIFVMQLEPNSEGNKFKNMEQDINKVTSAFEKLSGKKCKQPKDPRTVTPKKITYNPFNITEDPKLAEGHTIPDITSVFAQELVPQILSAQRMGKDPKGVVAEYAILMIKEYFDNAGYVPMRIVDQIVGQIDQVAYFWVGQSYASYNSLKEYILSKIYKYSTYNQ